MGALQKKIKKAKPKITKEEITNYLKTNDQIISTYMLFVHCRKTLETLNKESISKGIISFYEKKLDYLEEELYFKLIESDNKTLVSDEFQKRLTGLRSELKYIYDSVFNIDQIKEGKIYFRENNELDDPNSNLVEEINDGKKISKNIFSNTDEFGNNFLHILSNKGNDTAIIRVVLNVLKSKQGYLLSKKNKNNLTFFDNLIKLSRHLVLEEIESKIKSKKDLKFIKNEIYKAELKIITSVESIDEFEYIYQNILRKISEVDLFTSDMNSLLYISQVLNNSLDEQRKESMEDLAVLIASYHQKESLRKDYLFIKEKYPNLELLNILESVFHILS